MMKITNFIVKENASLLESMELIEKNTYGIVFVATQKGKIFASLTDGDIRRYLLKNGQLGDLAVSACNKKFQFVYDNFSRADILKLFDQRIKVIPVLDHSKNLKRVAEKSQFLAREEKAIYARSKAPVRISFGGGGSDKSDYFLKYGVGAVVNSAINLYSRANLIKRKDKTVKFTSDDFAIKEEFSDTNQAIKESKLGLFSSVLKLVSPDFGFELTVRSDFPPNSGLGGSSAVCCSILGCFNEFRIDKWSRYEISELAYQAERIEFGVEGGWQDQYASSFGGTNYIEFAPEKNTVQRIHLKDNQKNELEACLKLVRVTGTHTSGTIHKDQSKVLKSHKVASQVAQNVKLCETIKEDLLSEKYFNLGRHLAQGWEIKKKFSNLISNRKVDEIYNLGISNGANGGKLLGAGGAGFMLFFVSRENEIRFLNNMRAENLEIMDVELDQFGLQSWSTRIQEVS